MLMMFKARIVHRFKLRFFIIALAALIVIVTGACKGTGNGNTEPVTLESIAVTTLPTKTTYITGEAFDPAGMVVTAYYSDGSSATVIGYTLEGFSSATVGTSTITVSYNGKNTSFNVTVQEMGNIQESIDVAITFNQIADAFPEIAVPDIYLVTRKGKPDSYSITLTGEYDFGSIKWYFNGEQLTGNSVSGTNGETLTLNSNTYSSIGKYIVTVEVAMETKPYNKAFTFTVMP